MAYSFQTFAVGEVLTASKMNQVEVNIRDHIHGRNGVGSTFDIVSIGTNPATVGAVRLANNTFLAWRNAGNTSDQGIKLDSNDDLLVDINSGKAISPAVDNGVDAGKAAFRFRDGYFGNSVRLPNNKFFTIRNRADTAWLNLVGVNANGITKIAMDNTVSIADLGTMTIGTESALIVIVDDSNRVAVFVVSTSGNLSTEVADPSSAYSPTVDTASMTNIYVSAGVVTLQNKTGVARQYFIQYSSQ